MADALTRAGAEPAASRDLAEDAVTAIQGALVTASALQDPELFGRTLRRLGARLEAAMKPAA